MPSSPQPALRNARLLHRFTVLAAIAALAVVVLPACSARHPSGKYECQGKPLSTPIDTGNKVNPSMHEAFIDVNCVVAAYDFKGNSSVSIIIAGAPYNTTYTMDEHYIRVKGTGMDLLLKMQDENTLVSESMLTGTYRRDPAMAAASYNGYYMGGGLLLLLLVGGYAWWKSKGKHTSIRPTGQAMDDDDMPEGLKGPELA